MTQQSLFINPDPVSIAPEELLDHGLLNQAKAVLERGIANDEQWHEVQRTADSIKDQKKKVESARKLKVGPFNEVVKVINDWFRPYSTQLEVLERQLGNQYTTYYRKKQEEAARLQREADAVAAAERKRLEKQAEKARSTSLFDDEVPAQPVQQAPIPKYEPPKPAAPIQKIQRVRVLDPEKVPSKYKVPDPDLLLAAFKAGITKIPGVEFYTEDVLKRSFNR